MTIDKNDTGKQPKVEKPKPKRYASSDEIRRDRRKARKNKAKRRSAEGSIY